jgi:hypothetical protein
MSSGYSTGVAGGRCGSPTFGTGDARLCADARPADVASSVTVVAIQISGLPANTGHTTMRLGRISKLTSGNRRGR